VTLQTSKSTFTPFTFFACAIFCAPACAIDPAWAIDPEPIQIGFLELQPSINTKVTPLGSTWLPNGEQEEAEFLLFKPRLVAFASDGKNQFSSTLEILNGNYSAPGAANFVDLRFEGTARVPLDQQNLLKLRSEFFNTHENLDAAFRKGNSAGPQRFTTSTVNGSYEYTTTGGMGRVVLDAGSYTKTYTDNTALSFRNHKDYNWGSTFSLRVLPGTEMVLQYRFKNVDYLDDRKRLTASIWEQDHNERNAYLGATWVAPAIVPGELRIVSGFKETAINAWRADAFSAKWETNVRWEPLRDSVVTLNADRVKREETGMFTTLDSTNLRYSWEYLWSSRLKSAVAGSYSGNTYQHSNRKDEGLGLKLRMEYTYSRWLNMFVAVGHDQRKSVLDNFNFTQHTFALGITATLEHLWGW
jgi:hypothetical protein